jgi:peptidoglycan/xylan/chitin deacetylase (PgdA/CDA1 family)
MLTIVMYHHVRERSDHRFPQIHAMDVRDFEGQLDYLSRHYRFCTPDDLVEAIRLGRRLPPRTCLLTFDDGLVDHHAIVLPRLRERGISALFFIAAKPLREGRLLDVQKIHLLLAAAPDHRRVEREVLDLLEEMRTRAPLPSLRVLTEMGPRPNRFDAPKTAFLKRLLQRNLPRAARQEVVDELFRRHVAADESELAASFYMGREQIVELLDAGMTIGGHGYHHDWMSALSENEQREEIRSTTEFLVSLGVPPHRWVMSYPYGDYDGLTIRLLEEAGFVAAMTVHPALADPPDSPFELGRLDPNDLPTDRTAPPSPWTLIASASPVPAEAGVAGLTPRPKGVP